MATSARFGRTAFGDEFLSLRFNANSAIALTDSVTRKFRSGQFQRVLADANAEMAIKIQRSMVHALNAQIDRSRQQRPGKRLEMALKHKDNRDVTASGYTVMRPSFLDSPESPVATYWRQIDQGLDDIYFEKVLFTNNGGPETNAAESAGHRNYGGPFNAPWTSGGSTRVGGGMYSRPQPPGYREMRMPMSLQRGVQAAVGPFRAFHFTDAGRATMRTMQGNVANLYAQKLASVGIKLSKSEFK